MYAPERIAGPPLPNPATEDAADVTKALAGAADAANIWIALSLIVHWEEKRNCREVAQVWSRRWGTI